MSDLSITVIESLDEWNNLAQEWRTLLSDSRSESFFLRWEWLSAWVDCCLGDDRQLFVLAFREKEALVGIAPLYISLKKYGPFPIREVRLLGSPDGGSDYLDVISRRGRERVVADALYDYLMGEGAKRWDILYLQDIPADALFILYFMKRIQAEGKYAELVQGSYCPIVELPECENTLLKELSQWRRKKFKQDIRVLHREQNVVHSVLVGDDVAAGLETFFRLYEEKGGWPAEGLRSLIRSFLARCGDDKPLQLDLLSVDNRAVAGLLHLKHNDTIAMYLMAVDKEFNPKISLGNLLVGLCLKNSIAAGHAFYDFLKGDESYKFHWATGGKSSMNLLFWQKRPAATIVALNRLLRHAGKLILR